MTDSLKPKIKTAFDNDHMKLLILFLKGGVLECSFKNGLSTDNQLLFYSKQPKNSHFMETSYSLTYVLHGGRISVLSRALANAIAPRKCSAWFPNRPVMCSTV